MIPEAIVKRLRSELRNHPRAAYVRITRKEAETLAADEIVPLGIDNIPLVRQVTRLVVRRVLRTAIPDDKVTAEVIAAMEGPWFGQETRRRVEHVDRQLAQIEATAHRCRSDLRQGILPVQMATGSGWDRAVRDLRENTIGLQSLLDGAHAIAYALAPKPDDA